MKIVELLWADIYRDGGSYEARFSTQDGLGYGLWLQRSTMPDAKGTHHRWLFEYRGDKRPTGCVPVITGSDEEHELVRRLNAYLEATNSLPQNRENVYFLRRLREMRDYILCREPCFPSDLKSAGFIL